MKIQGPTQSQVNVYKNNTHKQPDKQPYQKRTDQLEISNEAKNLQQSGQSQHKRTEYVNQIKQSYENGTYKVQPEKVAAKMIEFWSQNK